MRTSDNKDSVQWTIELESKFKQDKIKLHKQNEEYLRNHPELKQLLHFVTTQVLMHKPDNVLEFMSELFKDGPKAQIGKIVRKRQSVKKEQVDVSNYVQEVSGIRSSIPCLNELMMFNDDESSSDLNQQQQQGSEQNLNVPQHDDDQSRSQTDNEAKTTSSTFELNANENQELDTLGSQNLLETQQDEEILSQSAAVDDNELTEETQEQEIELPEPEEIELDEEQEKEEPLELEDTQPEEDE